jgi:uncharacterized lipoprotein YmbA
MSRRPLTVWTAALFAISGCGTSPPTHFFTLTPMAPATRSSSSPYTPVQVDAFRIPSVLDRKEIVRSVDGDMLELDEQDNWGAPLDEMALDVLAQDLMARMPKGSVILPDAPAPPGASHLEVDVATFREGPDRKVRLEGSWTLLKGNPAIPAIHRDVNLSTIASSGDTAAQVTAMSQLLGRLADEIALELQNHPTGTRILSTRKGV